jgi:hypothetical protein
MNFAGQPYQQLSGQCGGQVVSVDAFYKHHNTSITRTFDGKYTVSASKATTDKNITESKSFTKQVETLEEAEELLRNF